MKLTDVRRLAIRKQLKIHYRLRNGMECIVNSEGIAQVPELKTIPDFNLEEEFAEAGEFLIEPALPAAPRKATRAELQAMTAASPHAAAAHDEHDDE